MKHSTTGTLITLLAVLACIHLKINPDPGAFVLLGLQFSFLIGMGLGRQN